MSSHDGENVVHSASVKNLRPWLGHIELLRGIAVTLVLLFHFQARGFRFGYLGVDIFFVVSGFLMYRLYGDLASAADCAAFFRRRIARLLPAYFVVLLATTIISAFVVLPNEFADVARNAYWSAALLPNVGFWSYAGYFQPWSFRPTLNLWSLGVEFQFYAMFPLVLLAGRRSKWLLVGIALLSCALFIAVGAYSPKTAFFQSPFRLWAFMAGVMVAAQPRRIVPEYIGVVAILIILTLLIGAASFNPIPSVLAVATVALTAMFIAAGLPAAVERATIVRPVRVLGRYSYSIYLVHFPIIGLLAYQPFDGTNMVLPWQRLMVALLLTAVSAFTMFHLVEMPLKAKSVRRRVVFGSAVAACATVCISAVLVPFNRTLLPPGQLLAADAWFDRLEVRCPLWGRIEHPLDRSCAVAGISGRGALLVGDSHADLLKGVLGKEIVDAGGALRLMQTVNAVGHPDSAAQRREADRQGVDGWAVGGLSPAAVLQEARARNIGLIIVHSNAAHVDATAIAELASDAQKCGIAVAMIMPVPLHGFPVPKYIYTTLKAGHQPRSRLTVRHYYAQFGGLAEHMRRLALDVPTFRVFFPDQYLCTSTCALEDPLGRPLYWDSQHLTQTGAAVIRPMLHDVAAMVRHPWATTIRATRDLCGRAAGAIKP